MKGSEKTIHLLYDRIEKLEKRVTELTGSADKYTKTTHKTQGKVLVLEKMVVTLGFALKVTIIFIAVSVTLRNRGYNSPGGINYALIAAAAIGIAFVTNRESSPLPRLTAEHMGVMKKLVLPLPYYTD